MRKSDLQSRSKAHNQVNLKENIRMEVILGILFQGYNN